METGKLSPQSADVVSEMRFSGNFGQPDGFGSVLSVIVRRNGSLCLRLTYKGEGDTEQAWAVELTNEQRKALAEEISAYDPTLWEQVTSPLMQIEKKIAEDPDARKRLEEIVEGLKTVVNAM